MLPKGLAIWSNMFQRPGTRLDLVSHPIWTIEEVPWAAALESYHSIIFEELLSNLQIHGSWGVVGGGHRSGGQHDGSVVARGSWRESVILGRGGDPTIAPRTSAILHKIAPSAVDLCSRGAGEVIFSLLAPHTHLSTHCAPSNVRLTVRPRC